MERTPRRFEGGSVKITVSVGVAQFGPDGNAVAQVLRAADERLYRAKAEGRNRVLYA